MNCEASRIPVAAFSGCPLCDATKPSVAHLFARLSFYSLLSLLVWLTGGASFADGATVTLQMGSTFSGHPLQLESLRYHNAAGEMFSLGRVSWLASGVAFQRQDGSWLELNNQVAWFDLERGRDSWILSNVPPAAYRSLRFEVGLEKNQNQANTARFPSNHPLNPNLNGLHWSWQGGYIFMALEGRWRDHAGRLDGWSYHFARDTNRTRITLALPGPLTNDAIVEIRFDLATLFNAPRVLSFARDGSSTHSREGDPIPLALKANLPSAFSISRISHATDRSAPLATATPLYMPEHFTPHVFRMSSTFPIPELPRDNPLIQERVALGERLFGEKALSKDGTLSCASCHDSRHAFSDPRRYSVGVRHQTGRRNAMPLFNLAWRSSFFWDGRAPSLRAQALMPIEDPTEMDESLPHVVSKLAALGEYTSRFEAAFGSPQITAEKLGLAIESFLLTKTSFDSKFDRALKGEAELNTEERRGLELFMTEYDPRRGQYGADCFHCHGGPLFQSQTFANNGLDTEPADPGRAKVTGKDSDLGKFATPSLRNSALTAPYMHDGRFRTLDQVIEHYNSGLKRSSTLDPNLAKHPDDGLRLSPQDKKALVEFLKSLTDPGLQK